MSRNGLPNRLLSVISPRALSFDYRKLVEKKREREGGRKILIRMWEEGIAGFYGKIERKRGNMK